MEKTLEKTYSIEPSLIDLNYCLIKSFPFSLPQNVVEDHQLLPSLKHDGYIAQVRMLNSLKRIFEELDIAISSPPNISFKMFKTGQKAKRVQSVKISEQFGQWNLAQHQRKTVLFFLQNDCKIIIGDDWNMGKTITSLACFHQIKVQSALVICPKVLLHHWYYHLEGMNVSNVEKIEIKVIDIDFKKDNIPESSQQKQNNKVQYTLISSEYFEVLRNKGEMFLKGQNFGGLIIDQYTFLSRQALKECKKMDNIIILANLANVSDTLDLIPLLNCRIDQNEIMNRYGSTNGLNNAQEFQKAIYRHYYIKNTRTQYSTPTLIKKVIIDSSEHLGQENKQGIGLAKAKTVYQYTKMLQQSQKIKLFFLVYVHKRVGKQISDEFCGDFNFKVHFQEEEGEQGIGETQDKSHIIICSLSELAKIIEQNTISSIVSSKQDCELSHRIILTELYEFEQKQTIDQLTSQIFEKYEQIQFLTYSQNQIEDQLIYPTITYYHQECLSITSSDIQDHGEYNRQYRYVYYDSEYPGSDIRIQSITNQDYHTVKKQEVVQKVKVPSKKIKKQGKIEKEKQKQKILKIQDTNLHFQSEFKIKNVDVPRQILEKCESQQFKMEIEQNKEEKEKVSEEQAQERKQKQKGTSTKKLKKRGKKQRKNKRKTHEKKQRKENELEKEQIGILEQKIDEEKQKEDEKQPVQIIQEEVAPQKLVVKLIPGKSKMINQGFM